MLRWLLTLGAALIASLGLILADSRGIPVDEMLMYGCRPMPMGKVAWPLT